MGKVQNAFLNGSPGAVSRSVDDIVISLKNVAEVDIPFGAPVFLGSGGAVPFSTSSPQDFSAFLGFAVRVADKTPDTYPAGQFNDGNQAGTWKSGDVMEILVRGGIAVSLDATGSMGGKVYIKKSDGSLSASAGESGTTVELQNVRIRNVKDASGCCEVIVSKRNII